MKLHRSRLAGPLACLTLAALAPPLSAQHQIYRFDGDTPTDRFGQAVDGAGDPDQDGFADLVVGVPEAHPGGRTNAGVVQVLRGLNGKKMHTFEGSNTNDFFGYAVAGVGDVDNDGVDDVAASSVRLTGTFNYVRVFSGQDGSLIHEILGMASAGFGASLSGLGDVDMDEHDDFLIGAASSIENGVAYVVSGFDGSPMRVHNGPFGGDWFGFAVSGGGDVDGDDLPDYVVGAPELGGGPGFVRIYSGLDGSLVFAIPGAAAGGQFGRSVCLERDVNGDGRGDVIVGAPNEDPGGRLDAGRVRVYSGSSHALIRNFDGVSAGDWTGYSVGAADVDDDGIADVIIGSPGEDLAGSNAGKISVHWAVPAGPPLYVRRGDMAGDALGISAAGAGFVRSFHPGVQDGIEDFIVGASRRWSSTSLPGYARVYSGSRFLFALTPSFGLP